MLTDLKKSVFRRTRRVIGLKSVMRRVLGRQRVEVEGCVMDVVPSQNVSDREIWLNGRHCEHNSLNQLYGFLDPTRPVTFFDIGGNSGTFTLPVAKRAAPGSLLLTFEPNPVMADLLSENLGLNGFSDRVQLHRTALGAARSQATLSMPKTNMGQGSLRDDRQNGQQITVPVAPLIDFVPAEGFPRPFLIKIDVEGYEDEVLVPFLTAAAEGDLPDAILIEVDGQAKWQSDLFGTLAEKGYRTVWEGENNALFTRSS